PTLLFLLSQIVPRKHSLYVKVAFDKLKGYWKGQKRREEGGNLLSKSLLKSCFKQLKSHAKQKSKLNSLVRILKNQQYIQIGPAFNQILRIQRTATSDKTRILYILKEIINT